MSYLCYIEKLYSEKPEKKQVIFKQKNGCKAFFKQVDFISKNFFLKLVFRDQLKITF